jgi:2-iminobutanoate/2-iminopropanoate deaminase
MYRVVLLSCLLLLGCAAGESVTEREVIRAPGSLEGLPFSSAVRVGDMLYLSGQIGNLPGTRELVPGGVSAETKQAMENIKGVLAYAGSGLERVVKCTVFMTDIADYQAVNAVYQEYFPVDPPARSAMAGSGLALGAKVEIECIALAGASSPPAR